MSHTFYQHVLIIVCLVLTGIHGIKHQIGHVPTKGNLWRAKLPHEIEGPLSERFLAFAEKCKTSNSEETNITYYYTTNGLQYLNIDSDNSICAYSLQRNLPPDELTGQASHIANFTLYFGCDDTCCAMECCQRDIQMTIVGILLIGISLLILVFYISVYLSGLFCAWRNGSLGRHNTGHNTAIQSNNNGPIGEEGAEPEKCCEKSQMVIQNTHTTH